MITKETYARLADDFVEKFDDIAEYGKVYSAEEMIELIYQTLLVSNASKGIVIAVSGRTYDDYCEDYEDLWKYAKSVRLDNSWDCMEYDGEVGIMISVTDMEGRV